jgi:histidine ammonia-lyase
LEARDGLALINGSNVLTALAAIILYDSQRWMKMHDIAAAMTLEALKANPSLASNSKGFSPIIPKADFNQ